MLSSSSCYLDSFVNIKCNSLEEQFSRFEMMPKMTPSIAVNVNVNVNMNMNGCSSDHEHQLQPQHHQPMEKSSLHEHNKDVFMEALRGGGGGAKVDYSKAKDMEVCCDTDTPSLLSMTEEGLQLGLCQEAPNNNNSSSSMQYHFALSPSEAESSAATSASPPNYETPQLLFEMAFQQGHKHLSTGDLEQALEAFGSALRCKLPSISRESGETLQVIADILFTIGSIHLITKTPDAAKSIQALQYCVQVQYQCYGRNHPSIAKVLHKLAEVYASIGEAETALDILLEALTIMLATGGDKTFDLASIWWSMGKQLDIMGHTDDARAALEEAKTIFNALTNNKQS